MGGVCCAERLDYAAQAEEKYVDVYSKDLIAFDKAYSSRDIPALLDLLDSSETFDQSIGNNLHPWAAKPSHITALVCIQLATLASENTVELQPAICEGIARFVKLLRSPKADIKDAALILLSFLSLDNTQASQRMFDSGIMVPLIQNLRGEKVAVCAASAQLLRNIYVTSIDYRINFIENGGLQAFVLLFKLENDDLILEVLYHLDDLLTEKGEEIPEILERMRIPELQEALEALQPHSDNDIKEIADQLFLRLAV